MENKDNDLREQIRKAEDLAHKLGEPVITAIQGDISTGFQNYKDFDPNKRFVPEMDQLYWAINWGWDKEPTTYCKFWTGTCDDYQNLYLGNCFRHKRTAEKLKYQYCEYLTGKKLPVTRLCCLQAYGVNFTNQSVDLYLDPNGYKHLDDLPLQIDDSDMVLVVQTFNNSYFECVIRLYTLSKVENYCEDVVLRLRNKLEELGLSRFDVFCSIAPTFKDRILPMLKPVDGVEGYSLCKL